MKLSKLVAFRTQLEKIYLSESQVAANSATTEVQLLLQDKPDVFAKLKQKVDYHAEQINQQFDELKQTVDQLHKQINEIIEQEEKHWFIESYKLYEQGMPHETTDYILSRRESLSEELEHIFTRRLENHVDWRFSGLIIRPGQEDFIRGMVANDPLYLVDQHYDLLVPALEKFHERYQRRLRTYVVNERGRDPIMQKIPDNQFGLCLVYNFFNFRPIEVIRQWLNEIMTKLRPGGVLIMTINDCDREPAVILAENYFTCYTPGNMILELTKSIGFDVLYVWRTDGPMTWIELRKPGELTSLRGGQTLAKVLPKPIAESK
jgi:SAM-dependent methyltransferase